MKVADFRLSSMWIEAGPELVGAEDHGRFGSLVRSDVYAKFFNSLLDTDGDALVSVPWSRASPGSFPAHSEYWNDYILKKIRDRIKGNRGLAAWKAIVPLRRKTPLVRIEGTDRCFVEGWYWPHGVGVSITLWSKSELSALEFETAIQKHLHGPLRVIWHGGQPAETTLNGIAAAALDKLRVEAFGPIAAGHRPQPMRVLTIVKALQEAADTDSKAAWKVIVDRAISAVGSDPNAEIAPERNIYSSSKGRVIWRPDRASTGPTPVHTMGCLHRNITVATLQVASLLRCAEMIGAAHGGTGLPQRVEPYARKIAGLIGRIYGGVETYRQKCLKEQIALANSKGAIDGLRQAIDLPPLTAYPKAEHPKAEERNKPNADKP